VTGRKGNGGDKMKKETKALITKLKENDENWEWYPTTDAIIKVVKSRCDENDSILDCGAGDGRVLTQLTKGNQYAIEKAIPLIQAMPANIIIVGTEFFQSTLIDKPVDVVFCNPPYSEYETWVVKLITEAHAKKLILVIPARWKDNPVINEAIESRKAAVSSLGTFDFLNAERAARAKVDILHITFKNNRGYNSGPDDPFNNWFDSEFNFKKADNHIKEPAQGSTLREKLESAVVGGRGKVPVLVELYNHAMTHLYDNFKQIAALDADLINELGSSKNAIMEALKQRIKGLKNAYWKELFDNLEDITSRLTNASRKSMLHKLTAQTNVDFTESNIYAVLIWVIKNANKYYDSQLIDIVEEINTKANIVKYKSNQKVYTDDLWRYRDDRKNITHYGLELRIVLERNRAIAVSEYGFISQYDNPEGLHTTAHDFINDLITIGNNLNFKTSPLEDSFHVGEWSSGKLKDFHTTDDKILLSVKAFKNGNLHIKFNQKFIRRLNVEFGRLKGWLKDKYQTAEELNIPVGEAAEAFNSNRQISTSNVKLLECL